MLLKKEMLFTIAFQLRFWWVTANKGGLKLDGTHQHLVYADDINLMGECILTIRKNIQAFLVTSKETGLEVNAEKFKYTLLSPE